MALFLFSESDFARLFRQRGAVLFAGGADGDFDFLAESGEKFH